MKAILYYYNLFFVKVVLLASHLNISFATFGSVATEASYLDVIFFAASAFTKRDFVVKFYFIIH